MAFYYQNNIKLINIKIDIIRIDKYIKYVANK